MNSKIQTLLAKYGRVGIGVYFTIFLITLFAFWILLTVGIDIRTWSFFSGLGEIGPIGLAYAATKITQPIRIALTFLMTPMISTYLNRSTEISED